MDYIDDLKEAVSSLPKALSWIELGSQLQNLNAAAQGTGLTASAEQTAKGWLITFQSTEREPLAQWRMTAQDPETVHKWPVEQFVQALPLLSEGYAAHDIEDLASTLRQLMQPS